ncbi:hypothetical protein BpHYR1_005286 [Brachionus plicatilis]|uniref:Uncharacterized protein n=1 Tax=Brachionus plicatilis TaxID=10195 RepID=A0A3M7PF57_BRAPC|nr:hypothetical protein BpHYR1_005286 [Brachionus plicatilis]
MSFNVRTSPALLVYRDLQVRRIQKDKGIILSFEFYFAIIKCNIIVQNEHNPTI